MEQSLSRKVEAAVPSPGHKAFFEYSKRLVRDLEGKGIIRTTVETTDFAIHAQDEDVLAAECIRTFPPVYFPAAQLLKREEVETLKIVCISFIAAVHAGGTSCNRRAYVEAPCDLLYGFRGREYDVDLLSPYEMLLH